jgi:hypothetical protein
MSEVLRNPVTLAKPGFWRVLHPTENRYKSNGIEKKVAGELA